MKSYNNKLKKKVKASVVYSDGIEINTEIVQYRSFAATLASLLSYASSLWRTRHSQDDDTGGYRFSRDSVPKVKRIVIDGEDVPIEPPKHPKKKVY